MGKCRANSFVGGPTLRQASHVRAQQTIFRHVMDLSSLPVYDRGHLRAPLSNKATKADKL